MRLFLAARKPAFRLSPLSLALGAALALGGCVGAGADDARPMGEVCVEALDALPSREALEICARLARSGDESAREALADVAKRARASVPTPTASEAASEGLREAARFMRERGKRLLEWLDGDDK